MAMKASSASPDVMTLDWLLAPSREGAQREDYVEIEPIFWRLDDRLAAALHRRCMTVRDKPKFDEFLRDISTKILTRNDWKMYDGQGAQTMSAREMLWIICRHLLSQR